MHDMYAYIIQYEDIFLQLSGFISQNEEKIPFYLEVKVKVDLISKLLFI